MAINRQNGLISRMKRTFEFWRSPAGVRHDARRIDPVLKLNLSPLMGRRDAAIDRAASFLHSDLFSLHENHRHELYRKTGRILELALEDCDVIIAGLSSQDTLAREKLLRSFIVLLHTTVTTLRNFAALEDTILNESTEIFRELAANQSGSPIAGNEKMLTGTEIDLVNRLRNCFDRTQHRINRYREYAKKSFSPVYAEKYRRAYQSYFDVYGRDDF